MLRTVRVIAPLSQFLLLIVEDNGEGMKEVHSSTDARNPIDPNAVMIMAKPPGLMTATATGFAIMCKIANQLHEAVEIRKQEERKRDEAKQAEARLRARSEAKGGDTFGTWAQAKGGDEDWTNRPKPPAAG